MNEKQKAQHNERVKRYQKKMRALYRSPDMEAQKKIDKIKKILGVEKESK